MVYLIIAGGAILNASFSLSYLGNNLGFAVGPLVGGILFTNHLKLFFFIDAFTTLIAAIIIYFFIKETYFEAKKTTTSELEKANDEKIEEIKLISKNFPEKLNFKI